MDFSKKLGEAIAAYCSIDIEEAENLLETPPEQEMGDFALPCFRLAKTLKKSPNSIAADFACHAPLPEFVLKTEVVGGYVNFFIKQEEFAKAVLEAIRKPGYGSKDIGKGKFICIDYSSINIAKPFHIGHLSSTVIGHSLYRIYEYLGYKCIGINHLGDWGTQFGKLIVAYRRWGNKEEVERNSIRALLELYVRFHKEAKEDERLNDEARVWFKRIEDGDDEALKLFEWFKALTLHEVGRVYSMLGIEFDSYAGESFYNDKMNRVIEELEDKNLLRLDNGAYLVELSDYDMPPCIVLRSDGATLYATRDIAAALYRKDTYNFEKCLYVVAYQQNLHFKQCFKVIELMGYEWANSLVHVPFGMVSMQNGTISTRKGMVVFLEDVLNRAIEKTLSIISEKSPELEDKPKVAQMVGVGAVVFNALYNSRIKDNVFSYENALNFDGETGPYAQYTHARCSAVLRKAEGLERTEVDYTLLSDEDSLNVLRQLSAFPKAILEASVKYEPYYISRAVIALAKAYNKFYYNQRILGEAAALENARLALTEAVKSVLLQGLNLIGLEAPERM